MARKKPTAKRKKVTKKKTVKKKAAKRAAKKAAARKPSALSKRAVKKKPVSKKTTKRTAARLKSAKKLPATGSLGRPKVTGEEKLYMLFKEDYHARQVFEFLRVETVKDLEQFAPQEIVHRLSLPIRQTVDRIRRLLAEKNRSLKDDREFARKHKSG